MRIITSCSCVILFAAGCAAPGNKPGAGAQIRIEESVGFTITEEAKVAEQVRTDYELALLHLEQGRADEGIELLEQVAAVAPTLSAPRIDLGIAYHRSGDLAAAEKHLADALALNPDHPIAYNELGILYRKTGRFADARSSYESALAIYPGYHFSRRNLAVLCDLYLSDIDCALTNYEAYLQTVPADEDVEMWIADLRNRRAQ